MFKGYSKKSSLIILFIIFAFLIFLPVDGGFIFLDRDNNLLLLVTSPQRLRPTKKRKIKKTTNRHRRGLKANKHYVGQGNFRNIFRFTVCINQNNELAGSNNVATRCRDAWSSN